MRWENALGPYGTRAEAIANVRPAIRAETGQKLTVVIISGDVPVSSARMCRCRDGEAF